MEVEEPSAEQRELLATYRNATEPDDEAVERALSRLMVRVEAEPRRAARGGGRRTWLAAAALLLVTLGGLGVVLASSLGVVQSLRPNEAEYLRVPVPVLETEPVPSSEHGEARTERAVEMPVEMPVESPVAEEGIANEDAAGAESAGAGGASEVIAVAKVQPRARKRAEQAPAAEAVVEPPASDLADESHLLAKARRALTKHDYASALEWAREHARRHPDGLLVEERLVIEAVAACSSGAREQGLASLAEARRRFGSFAAEAEIEAACASD